MSKKPTGEVSDVDITQEMVREFLDYDPLSGGLLWKVRSRKWFLEDRHYKIWNGRFAGKRAGSLPKNTCHYACFQVSIFRKKYLAHRIIWLWVTGEWPKLGIDHKDRDPTNNKWDNLRLADRLTNGKNLNKRRDNTSGVTGVSWFEGNSKWKVRGYVGGKSYHLGYFEKDDLDLAAMAILEFRAEHNFEPTHGI